MARAAPTIVVPDKQSADPGPPRERLRSSRNHREKSGEDSKSKLCSGNSYRAPW
ncbi:hypothetical protein M2232_007207 [Bradyrhizobium japonicum]|nr:hypothetical protein [Bradyrhizobium japonicum]MCW2348287.1 hypothetical protein [Bradyrhizobium japonicum]